MYYGFIYRNGRPTDPMMKLTFIEGEGEATFTDSGSHYRGNWHQDYKITGSWGPQSEDGRTPVELVITYGTKDLVHTELKGVFDPDENSVRGDVVMPMSDVTGEVVFKRDPNFVRFYPAPSTISARKRWEFATTSVLDRVRQQAWSSKRILATIRDGKRFMELALRGCYGKNLTGDREDELLSLYPGLYEADAQFYASLVNVKLSETPIFT